MQISGEIRRENASACLFEIERLNEVVLAFSRTTKQATTPCSPHEIRVSLVAVSAVQPPFTEARQTAVS
jgi:hypothetical protein